MTKETEQHSYKQNELSKSELKRQAEQLQDLGEYLLTLKPQIWQTLPIDAQLLQALQEAHKHNTRIAHRRHMQFIGKLMRKVNMEELENKLMQFSKQTEHLKDRQANILLKKIIENDDNLTEFIKSHTNVDIQKIRNITRIVRKNSQESTKLLKEIKLYI